LATDLRSLRLLPIINSSDIIRTCLLLYVLETFYPFIIIEVNKKLPLYYNLLLPSKNIETNVPEPEFDLRPYKQARKIAKN